MSGKTNKRLRRNWAPPQAARLDCDFPPAASLDCDSPPAARLDCDPPPAASMVPTSAAPSKTKRVRRGRSTWGKGIPQASNLTTKSPKPQTDFAHRYHTEKQRKANTAPTRLYIAAPRLGLVRVCSRARGIAKKSIGTAGKSGGDGDGDDGGDPPRRLALPPPLSFRRWRA